MLDNLVDASLKRDVVICAACSPHIEGHKLTTPTSVRLCDYVVDPICEQDADQALPVVTERWQSHIACAEDEDGVAALPDPERPSTSVLGLPLQDFAAALAALTDQEEIVLSLIHPLVQVFTVPRTGQLAYVGHVCNFRQNVSRFLTSLPALPEDMPFVMVRPSSFRGRVSNKAPFKINVARVRAAFVWLKAHNPYYLHVSWDESSARAWSAEDVVVGTTREEDYLNDQPLSVTQEEFERWMLEAESQKDSPEQGFSVGQRLRGTLADQQQDTSIEDPWSLLRTLAADLQQQRYLRAATSLPETLIAATLHAHGALELQIPSHVEVASVADYLGKMPQSEWCPDFLLLCSELPTVRALCRTEEPTVALGGFSAAPPGEDVGQREEVLQNMAAAVTESLAMGIDGGGDNTHGGHDTSRWRCRGGGLQSHGRGRPCRRRGGHEASR